MSTQQNPLASAHASLLERLALIQAPRAIRIFPGPSDFEAVQQYIREVAEVVDDLIAAVGFQVADNATIAIDCRDFDHCASGATTDAAYACERAADALRYERDAA